MRHRIALATADGALEQAARAEGIEIVLKVTSWAALCKNPTIIHQSSG
jgi:hypothetical protein